jgi:hypothetical protein
MKSLRFVAAAAALAAILTAAVAAQARTPQTYRPKPAEPTTNVGLAQKYEQEATTWRWEAANHRQMAIDYKRFSKSPLNPAIPRMEQHCNAIIEAAEARAAEADSLAAGYRLRAKSN